MANAYGTHASGECENGTPGAVAAGESDARRGAAAALAPAAAGPAAHVRGRRPPPELHVRGRRARAVPTCREPADPATRRLAGRGPLRAAAPRAGAHRGRA